MRRSTLSDLIRWLLCVAAVGAPSSVPSAYAQQSAPSPPPVLQRESPPPPGMVRAEGQTRAVPCVGGPADISGNGNTLVVSGACSILRLRGDANTITIQLGSGAEMDIEGNRNRIRYTLAGGGTGTRPRPPTVRVSGNNVDLAPEPGTPAPTVPSQPLALTGDGMRLELDCADRAVTMLGNRSHYVLRGGCRGVVIRGDGNAVVAELMPGASVEIQGNGTGLSYTTNGAGEPVVTVLGLNSAVTRAAGALPAAPVAPLTPAPDPATAHAVPPGGPALGGPAPGGPAPGGPAPGGPPMPAADPPMTVPVLMRNLGGEVVAAGTVVAFQADMLFDGATATLHDAAAGRLTPVVQLIRQIDPRGLLVTVTDTADADLAKRRAAALRDWFANAGQIKLPIEAADAVGTPAASILIRRR